jgi:Flp pilus assembly protein TadD
MRQRTFAALGVFFLLVLSACSTLPVFREGQASFDAGLAQFNQGNFQEAIPHFQRATVENPDFAQAYLYLGRSYVSLGRWREAIRPLRTAYRLAPDDTKQEVFNLLMDALFAAALDGLAPDRTQAPRETL